MKEFSIVIPIFNEEKNIRQLVKEIYEQDEIKNKFELIFVNDKSMDESEKILKNESKVKDFIYINNKNNIGQSLSIYKGVRRSSTKTIVTMDGDLQNDPSDIKKLYNIYFSNNNIKLVSGIRFNRKDSIIKKISSKIANFVRRFYLNDNCVDTGCSLKIFDKNIFLTFEFFDGIHRFIPSLNGRIWF
jgi:Glycosyltransferases involved in cell wall biogenesis